MTISQSSRYAVCSVVTRTTEDGVAKKVLLPRPTVTRRASVTTYQWKQSDRVDLLAQQFYQDPTQWWRFADMNPQILNWEDVKPGTMLRIPRVA
ncbi:hypothetical protein [Streptomyces sp. NBC_00470]|uniref:hypothetical protein n=1 Tax=Streptomyces sp. NBC_00470 TaxID=2975753 RepID=UPI0030E56F33